MSAIAVRPQTIGDAELSSSDAAETVALWNGGTSYAEGDYARSDVTHRIYRSTAAANLGNDPTDPANLYPAAGATWVEYGPTNAWAMFDDLNDTATSWTESGEVVLTPDYFDALGLYGLVGSSVRVRVNDGTSDVYDQTFDLVSAVGITDWYSWFFEYRGQVKSLLLDDIPPVPNPIVTVTITGATGTEVSIATLSLGRQLNIGETEFGLALSFRDYSVFEEDDFGKFTVVQRGYSNRADARLLIRNNRVDQIRDALLPYRARPIFWGLTRNFKSTNFFGFFKRLDVEIAYPTHSLVTIQLWGTTE